MSPIHLAKRDDLSSALHPFLMTFYVLLGCTACLLGGYATHRLMGMKQAPSGYKPRSVEQDDYMREVRRRNLDVLMADLRSQRKRPI
ncbi:hypothetical protein K491DRAFT_715974 [Lophiostoma macrostomum CBS 122681]|uniref:Uncharacterized protein n=1 Tax=Lophiostoma macrostomum CBS 122681 TaxID=1314788 RepID=A0A6A6T733_9PLEO|nr:hypothetical protein K491DRAFT_715974 [Lophiostoma macrostomum CBS 122681]